ncbi:MAG: UvrD-helicase domain-containing protein [Firmicutes bacterium]|nr:UvrD-helicase domain-containing protein [Bacillota bacterium]
MQNIIDKRTKKHRTITGEFLRSSQEVQIANFLYLNGVEYEYERPYENKIPEAKKTYTPDFYLNNKVYLEHFGIRENLTSNLYNKNQLNKYIYNIEQKRKVHREYSTRLIETWSEYNDNRSLIDHLKEELINAGIKLKHKSNEEIYKKLIVTSKDKYVFKFIMFMIQFIEKFKTNGYELNGFNKLRKKTDNVRTLLFLDIAKDVYKYYQQQLIDNNQIDFADMINDAEKILDEISKTKLSYKYIIIDEFQDVARQRFNLTKKLSEVTGAKVSAVGDDWQSIFAFAGSDITLFQKFLELMGDGKEIQITHTYRNSQELIDIAGSFIQKNQTQIKKKLVSPKHLENPIVITGFNNMKNYQKNWIQEIENTVGKILVEYGEKSSILMVGRYNFDKYKIVNSEKFKEKWGSKIESVRFPNANITFMTAHSSKGLGFDNVILINMQDDRFGFPSQVEDDPIMKLVKVTDYSVPFAEERRLFYVALTRTKNKVYMIVPKSKPSRFVIELIKDYNIAHSNDISMQIMDNSRLRCPKCGFLLKYENNKNYGIPLYMCSNDPEICDFMTNDRICLQDIYKCNKCEDGYMIIKTNSKTGEKFYGCTNYGKAEGSCNNMARIEG